jgi:hypothetical protein
MNARNCVHFVAEAVGLVGLKVPNVPQLMKRPTSYMNAVAAANRDFPTLKLEPRRK